MDIVKTNTDVDVERFVYLFNLTNTLFKMIQDNLKDDNLVRIFTSAYMSNIEELKNLARKLGIKCLNNI